MSMLAVLTRVIARDRQGHRPAHAMAYAKSAKRAGIRNRRNRARHAADDRIRIAEALATRRAVEGMRQRVIRTIHASRIPELVVSMLADSAPPRQWGVRTARTPAFSVGVITCLVSAGVAGAAAPASPTDGPGPRGIGITRPAAFATVSGSSLGSRLTSGQQPLTGAAPLGDVHSENPEDPGPDRPLDSRGVTDDPQLEQALIELDKQADLDQLMWQQRGLEQPPALPAAGPPAALPDGQAPAAPAPATAPAPQSGPPTVTPSDEKPAGAPAPDAPAPATTPVP